MEQEILRLEGVSYRYPGEESDALRDCSLAIRAREKIAVLGGNGAGKSTLFLLANGVMRPTGGRTFFLGREIARERDLNALRRGVGLVFQDPDVQILAGTVEEEVSFGPVNLGLSRKQADKAVDEALAALELEAYRQRAPQYLSGGEKKRVTIADVLAIRPRLMLLDEPASSLDPSGRRRLEKHLERLHEAGLALVVATHDLEFAWRWARRVLVFDKGCLTADGAPEKIFQDEELLNRCGLEKPLLCQVAQALDIRPPRSIEELLRRIGKSTG